LTASADSSVRDEKIGHVEIYYTDSLLAEQIAASREKARKEIEYFHIIIEKRIDRAFIAQILSVLCVILVLVGSIVASLHFIVLKPMKECLHFAQRMSGGDFSGKLDIGRKDEIGTLAGALNHMSTNLGQVLAKISEGMKSLAASSAKLLATAQKLSSGSEELTAQAGTAATATEKINDNIYAVTNTAETMSVQSQSIASSAKEMSSDVNSVAASIEEMSASIKEVAQNCSKAKIMAEEARGASHNAEKKMTELDAAAQDIGKIIDAIQEITEQIKLLALNATIEAARSGEAGRGFRVVANEVKNLAVQTSRATQDIAQQIGGIQNKTSSVVADIQMVADINSQFNDHTSTIAAAVEEQNSTTTEIARIVAEVARNSDNVSNLVESFSRNIEQEVVSALKEAHSEVVRVSSNNHGVNNVAQETARAANSINAAAKELSRLANELQQQVGQFKTG
jgi:methyl-accepting chemotaxis protein